MLTSQWTRIAPSIVMRLRIVFALIAVTVVSAAIVSIVQVYGLKSSVSNLTTSTVAIFIKSEETERSLKNLNITLQLVDAATSPEELIGLSSQMRSTLKQMQAQMTDLGAIRQTGEVSDEMVQSLAHLEEIAAQIVTAKAATLRHDDRLRQIDQNIRTTRDTMHHILEDETFKVAPIDLRGDLERASGPQLNLSQIEQNYSQHLLHATAITSIALEIETLSDKVNTLKNVTTLREIQNIESDIRFKLRSITTLLSQIQGADARAQLAQSLIQMRDALVGDAGAVKEATTLLLRRSDLKTHIEDQLLEAGNLSAVSKQLTTEARQQIDRDNAAVNHTTSRMIWALGAAVFAVLVSICATTLFVIERQISQRMSKLTHAVLSIADGQTDYDVDVSGVDEIGKMAQSLEVFKSNADELVRSNFELERFAYVAAHDLRSPLRAIQDLTDWISQDDENILSTNSTELIGLLDNRVERLNRLLSDLLEYSRVGTEADVMATISVDNTVREIAEMLDPDRNFTITYLGTVEKVTTLATPFNLTLRNLLNNGMKHHDRLTGSLRVSATIQHGRLCCTVTDDGPGIDPKYHDKIFGLFQTLKPRDEVEGSGLGLAIIRKLIGHYRGSISVESDPETKRGTVFRFDLPIDAPKTRPLGIAA